MSRSGKRVIKRFPEHSPIHDPENDMHGLLDKANGEWSDRDEDLIYKVVEKRKIITNVSDENDPASEDYLMSGYFLDIQGDEYDLTRKENETNTEYRARILGIRQNNISLEGIALIVASILNIPVDEVEIINNRDALRFGDKIYNRISGEKHKPVFNKLVRTRGIIFIKVHEIDDPEFLISILEKCVLAFVEIVLLYSRVLLAPENLFYADVGDDVDFGVILLDQDDKPQGEKLIVFYDGDRSLGSSVTDGEGRATLTMSNIRFDEYSLRGRYSKTWSTPHTLIVKYGLKLTLEGPTIADDEELLKYVVTATNKKGNKITDLVIQWFVNGQQVSSCITNPAGECAYCFTPSENGVYEIYVKVSDDVEFHDTISNKIYLEVSVDEELTDEDCIVDFVARTGLSSYELEEVKDIANDIRLYGEKWIPWDFPLDDVEEYFNNDFSNMNIFAGRKRLKYIWIVKANHRWLLVEIPYYKFDQESIALRAVIYADLNRRIYYNPSEISRNYYDLANGIPVGYISNADNELESDENEIVLTMDNQGVFKADNIEYRDILSVEKVNRVSNSYKSFVDEDNIYTDVLPNRTLSIGTKDNHTGLFITPIPDTDLDSDLDNDSRFPPEENKFLLTRLMMNRSENYARYYNDLPDRENIAIKESYKYNGFEWLKYFGSFHIALLIVMQNILQVKYRRLINDEDYEVTYPFVFEHYDLTGLSNVSVEKQTTAPSLVDITQESNGYYKSVLRTRQETGYTTKQRYIQKTCQRTVYDTITPPRSTLNLPNVAVTTNTNTYWNIGNGPNNVTPSYITIRFTYTATGGVVGAPFSVGGNQFSTQNSSQPGVIYGASAQNRIAGPGPANLSGATATVDWNSYQTSRIENYDCSYWESYQEPYSYTVNYTNANFRSGKLNIKSDNAELVIENNQQVLGVCNGYNPNGTIKSTLFSNQNVKFATINNWLAGDYTFELTYPNNPGNNLFTNLFLKNIYEDITLEDVSFELEMSVVHGLTQLQVNNLVSADNANRNIYRQIISVTNFPKGDKKLKKLLRSDFKNIRFVLKEDQVLLNHSVDSNGNFMIEMPNKYLTADMNLINVIVMPLDYEYDSDVDVSLSTLPVLEVNYAYV